MRWRRCLRRGRPGPCVGGDGGAGTAGAAAGWAEAIQRPAARQTRKSSDRRKRRLPERMGPAQQG